MRLTYKVPKFLGYFIFAVGFFNVTANIFRPFRNATHRIDSYTLVYVNSTAFSTSLISGLFLILISRGIIKRKKRAWKLAVILSFLGIVVEGFRFHIHFEHVIINLILLILLITFRKEFYAKSDPAGRHHPFISLVISLITFIFIGVLLLLFRHHSSIIGSPSFSEILRTVLNGMVGIQGPVKFSSDRATDTVFTTLLIFGISTVTMPMLLLFRKIAPKNQIGIDEAEQIKKIVVENPQSDSLSYFSTRLDKSVMWSDSRTAGQSYRVQNGVLLAAGDPFGHYSLWSEVMDKLIDLAEEYAWTLAVMGCSERAGELWMKKTNMAALHIGDEAIIHTKDFTLEGSNMKNVREMINKTKRLGYSTECYKVSDLSFELRELLKNKAVEWRYGEKERGFSMALDRFMNEIDDREIFIIARKNSEVMGFMTFSPWGKKGMSLDRMLRNRDADTGVNELIITSAVEFAKNMKIDHISLNFAAFRTIFEEAERISAGPVLRLKRNLLRFISKWVQVESLYRFNAKFQPDWNPRYLIYPGPTKLIEIGFAVGKAEGLI